MTLRAFVVVLFGILVSSFVAAQSPNDTQPQQDTPREVSTWPSTPYLDQNLPREADDHQGVCFTMRTYLFAKQDEAQPRLVATYTCTPTRQRDLKRAKAEPKVIPAK